MPEYEQFDVFLSNSSQDRSVVRQVANELRHRGLRPWLEEDELLPGQPWMESLQRALNKARAIVVLVGKDSVGPWQQVELDAFLRDSVRRGMPVIPVLLPGAPEYPRLPIFLQQFSWIDLRHGLSKEALDRLQWGITGKRPSVEIVEQHEEQIDLFLCFRGSDRQAVQHIAQELMRNQIRTWPNDWSLSPEDSWQELLSGHTQRINALAVFAGDEGGPWIDDQVESFIWELIESDRLVVPAILPTASLDPKFPVYLRRRQIVDFRKSVPNAVSLLSSLLSSERHDEKGSLHG